MLTLEEKPVFFRTLVEVRRFPTVEQRRLW